MPPKIKKSDISFLVKLGERIQSERKARALTQEKAAELTGLSVRGYQRIEAGDMNPTATTLARIRAVLGCTWDRMFP